MKIFIQLFFLPLLLMSSVVSGQRLNPGFDPEEYIRCLDLGGHFYDTLTPGQVTEPAEGYEKVYGSDVAGLYNKWEMWQYKKELGVISIRGTIGEPASWLENFYAAMVPASGTIKVSDSTSFDYQLSSNEKAMVHVGWLTGLAVIAPSMLEQVKKLSEKGIRDFIIIGHSQGGALAFMVRSYFEYLDKGVLPEGVRFKTYCSAAPKPGNQYYAYDFDFITRNGWGFRIVNTVDWVPETPFSLQTVDDFNTASPFGSVKSSLKKQSFVVRAYGNMVYNKLDKSSRKSVKTFQKYLGKTLFRQVKKAMPGMEEPEYAFGNNYQTAGVPIVLVPDEAYQKKYVYNGSNVFVHHGFGPYKYLVRQTYIVR